MGVKLFNRGKYIVTLSEEGLLFRRRAQEFVDLAEKAKLELIQDEKEFVGEISIGCNESQSVNTLADMINGFRHMHAYYDPVTIKRTIVFKATEEKMTVKRKEGNK